MGKRTKRFWFGVNKGYYKRGLLVKICYQGELFVGEFVVEFITEFVVDIFQVCKLAVVNYYNQTRILIIISLPLYFTKTHFIINYFYMHTFIIKNHFYYFTKMKKFDKLIKFVRKGQIDKASEILQQTTLNINQLDQKTGKSLLHIVIQNSDGQMLKLLLSYPGIDLQRLSKQGQLPLETAISLNDFPIVSKLLQTGNINPKKKTQNQQTLFEVAIRLQTSKDILNKLISYKFDPNQSVPIVGSLINLAIVNKQIDNLIFLLNLNRDNPHVKEPANITITDQNDNTCLILAVQHNQGDAVLAILEYLVQPHCKLSELQKQFLLNSQNKQGNTALHIACQKNLQTITLLLQSHGLPLGLDLSLKNKKQQTTQSIKKQVLQSRLLSQQQQKRSFQQKKIYQKQKQIEKQRLREEEERFKLEEKRRRKEEEMVREKQIVYQRQLNKKKGLYICGIVAVAIVLLMYLVLTNSIEQKKLIGKDQFAK